MVTKTVFLWCIIAPISISWSKSYNHDWAVELEGDDVTAVASATDCEYKHHIIDNWHLFRCHHVQRRSIEADLKVIIVFIWNPRPQGWVLIADDEDVKKSSGLRS